MARLFRRWSKQQDERSQRPHPRTLRGAGAPGIVVYALTITFASIDWVMSLEPDWYSTIYPVMFSVGQLLNGFAFALTVLLLLADRPPFAGSIRPSAHARFRQPAVGLRHFLGVHVVLAVFAHLGRQSAGRDPVVSAPQPRGLAISSSSSSPSVISLCRFCCCCCATSRSIGGVCLAVAVGLLAMRFLDMFWWVEPAFNHEGNTFSGCWTCRPGSAWADLCIWWFLGRLRSRPLLPLNDPNLAEALRDE